MPAEFAHQYVPGAWGMWCVWGQWSGEPTPTSFRCDAQPHAVFMWHQGMHSMLTLPPSLKVRAAILQLQSEVTEALVSPGQIAVIGKWMALTEGSWQTLEERLGSFWRKVSRDDLMGLVLSKKWLIFLPVSNMERAVGHGLIDGCHVSRSHNTILLTLSIKAGVVDSYLIYEYTNITFTNLIHDYSSNPNIANIIVSKTGHNSVCLEVNITEVYVFLIYVQYIII